MIGDLDYFFPQAGYLLFFLVFLWLGLWSLFLYRQRQLAKFASPRLLNQLLIPRSSWMFCFKTILMSLSWLFACLSLMGPYGNVRYASSQQPNKPSSDSNLPRRKIHDVIFLLDTSPSMGVRDTTEELSRLEKSKQIVEQILQRLRGQEASLYAFSSELIPLVPPTLDYIFTRLLLDDITISEGETNFKAALEGLKAEFFTVPSSRLYSLIILSDGEDREVQKLTGDAKQKAIAKLATIIPNPAEFHLRVFTIGIGSKQGGEVPNVRVQGRKVQSKLEPELLEALAQNGRGGYFEASQMPIWSLADTLFDQIQQDFPYYPDPAKQAREVLQTSPSNILYDLYFQWPLALSLLCLLAYLCLPDAKGKTNSFHLSLIFFLLIPFGLPSLSPEEKQESAQGIALFAARDYNKATDIFERLSKRSLKNWQKSLALYDLGTIYLAQGQWKQAQDLYQSIAASEIHSPTFLRYLAFNEAIAYFGQAQEQLSKMQDQALFASRPKGVRRGQTH
jgi:Ca-activated chloride channel homolog